MGVWHILLANLKKKKDGFFSVGLLIFLAALFINIGLSILTTTGDLFDTKANGLNGPDFIAISSMNEYKKDYDLFLEQDERIELFEKEEVIYIDLMKQELSRLEGSAYVFDANKERSLARLVPLEELEGEEGIYLPIALKGYGYELGGSFTFTYKNQSYMYKIVGFFETPYYGVTYSPILKCFLTEKAYQELYEELGAVRILSAKLKDGSQAEAFRTDFVDTTRYGQGATDIFSVGTCLTSQDMKQQVMLMVGVLTTMLIAFGMILTFVVLVVIRFKVNENIETNMRNIGSLQAMGYTSKQIVTVYVLEFLVIGIVAALLATIGSYVIMPALSDVQTMAAGFTWEAGLHLGVDVGASGILLGFVVGVTVMAARRIHKLPPVDALRKGIRTHHFKKNHMPLDKLFGSIHLRLLCKQLIMNMKQNMMVFIVIAIGTFAVGFMSVMYTNFAFDHTAVYSMVGLELCDVQVKTTRHTQTEAFAKELQAIEGVRKTNLSDIVRMKVEGIDVQLIVSDNFEAMEVLEVYEGSFPIYDNEIVITGVLAEQLGKTIGDSISADLNGVKREYYITGLNQTTNGAGKMGIIHLDGIKRLMPHYELKLIDVYLEGSVDIQGFINQLEATYKVADTAMEAEVNSEAVDQRYVNVKRKADEKIAKLLAEYGIDSMEYALMIDGEIVLSGNSAIYKIEKVTNYYEFLQLQLTTYASMMSSMVTVMLGITFLVIGAILSLVIKSMIRARKVEYGVYKAMGYTTLELMNHIALNFTVVALVGTTIGTVLTLGLTNPLLGVMFYPMGLSQLTFAINPMILLVISMICILFVYGVAMAVTYRIRKITAYELLTE